MRILISPQSGSEQLLQRVFHVPPGASASLGHPGADDVLYVVRGRALLRSGPRDDVHALVPGTAVLVPAKVPATVDDVADEDLALLSVLSPPPFDGYFTMEARDLPVTTIHEHDREALPAGDDRYFKLLIGPEHGARNVTQFVGFIGRSKAPPHTHTYEEAIYILEGEGLVHIGDLDANPIRAGTSIFLPPGTPHCLENRSDQVLKLLGVFSPPGSPAARLPGGDT
jgi:quercetin dioxygenase-like cupin family protein